MGFFAGEALCAGPNMGTVEPVLAGGQETAQTIMMGFPAHRLRPLKFRAQELLAEPGILEAPSVEQAVHHDRDPVHRW